MPGNILYYGDNLDILREKVFSETVDLIYLDPPFNSNRNYNVLFRDEKGKEAAAQIEVFEDTWHWNATTQSAYVELLTEASPHVSKMLSALHDFIGSNQMMAYLVMMAARLVELHRVLKPTGSIYLHCDPTASHYLKLLMDSIFGVENYRNEIIWKRTQAHNDPNRNGRVHDVILFYAKDVRRVIWKGGGHKVSAEYLRSHYASVDSQGRQYQLVVCHAPGPGPARTFFGKVMDPPAGRHWTWTQENIDRLIGEGRIVLTSTGGPRLVQYAPETVPLQYVWTDIDPVNSQAQERLGYPTQKPLSLLERIISASTEPEAVVLDPFCGCGTAIAAAQKLGRCWTGVDITHLAITLQRFRLESAFPDVDFEVIGEPKDVGAAHLLAETDRYQFQWWALSLVRALPLYGQEGSREGRKGRDRGIDGVITFIDDATGSDKRIIVQVKSGHVQSGDIRDLRGTLNREQAAMAVFLTLQNPTRDMEREAIDAGSYESAWGTTHPRLQILTVEGLLNKTQRLDMPPQRQTERTFKRAQRVKRDQQTMQPELELAD